MGFLVGLYITIHPHFLLLLFKVTLFVEENCAIGNIVIKWEILCRMNVAVFSFQIFNAARQLSHIEAAPDKSGKCSKVGFAHLKEK